MTTCVEYAQIHSHACVSGHCSHVTLWLVTVTPAYLPNVSSFFAQSIQPLIDPLPTQQQQLSTQMPDNLFRLRKLSRLPVRNLRRAITNRHRRDDLRRPVRMHGIPAIHRIPRHQFRHGVSSRSHDRAVPITVLPHSLPIIHPNAHRRRLLCRLQSS
jgi:hypothetical protein